MARKSRKQMKRRKSRKSRRRRRGGSTNNPEVMKFINRIFYNPKGSNIKSEFKKNWESEWTTMVQQLKCYLGNMHARKGMSRQEFKAKKDMFSNPTKRQAEWRFVFF